MPLTNNPIQDYIGSISEVITLDTPCSGDERKAESICCLISCVFSSQFGHEQQFQSLNPTSILLFLLCDTGLGLLEIHPSPECDDPAVIGLGIEGRITYVMKSWGQLKVLHNL